MRVHNKYLSIILVGTKKNLVYRADFILNFVSALVMITVQYFLWSAVFSKQASIKDFDFTDMIKYVLGLWFIFSFVNTQSLSYVIQNKVVNGDISCEFLMPLRLYLYYFIDYLSQKLLYLLFSGLPALLISVVLYRVSFVSWINMPLFFMSLFLAFVIAFNISFLVGIFSVFFKNIEGFIQFERFLRILLSGGLVPLAFFPGTFEKITFFFPYRYIFYVPVMIFTGKMPYKEMLINLPFQFLWAIALTVFAQRFFYRIKLRAVIFGG
ncbi:ABC-2 family transporter protein [candidate division WOR-3 bacterium]|nr:ABC-2 family transporter protein [candidate division WOR-3 bacterium]